MSCDNKTNGKKCSCTYPGCHRHGKCCECVEYHRSCGELPGCFFNAADEKTYDRSIAFFVRNHKD